MMMMIFVDYLTYSDKIFVSDIRYKFRVLRTSLIVNVDMLFVYVFIESGFLSAFSFMDCVSGA